MAIGHRRNAPSEPWHCCLIFTPLVARQDGSRTAACVLLNTSMGFAIMTTGYAICSLPPPLMAGGLSPNLLTQIELEPGSIKESLIGAFHSVLAAFDTYEQQMTFPKAKVLKLPRSKVVGGHNKKTSTKPKTQANRTY
jgi:hypothetical protein